MTHDRPCLTTQRLLVCSGSKCVGEERTEGEMGQQEGEMGQGEEEREMEMRSYLGSCQGSC